MTRRSALIISAFTILLALATAGYLYFRRDRDEEIIHRRMDEIVALVEKQGDESMVLLLSQARQIQQYIARNPVVDVGPPLPLIRSPEEIVGIVAQVRQNVRTLQIRILNRSTLVDTERRTATTEVEAEATGAYAGETGRERRIFNIDWIVEDGRWVISHVRLIDILERVNGLY